MSGMFNGDSTAWDVSSVQEMSGMFNQNISKWDVSAMQSISSKSKYLEVGRVNYAGHVQQTKISRSGTYRLCRACSANQHISKNISKWDVSAMQCIFSKPRHLEVGRVSYAGGQRTKEEHYDNDRGVSPNQHHSQRLGQHSPR
jgi:hypothetical protein